MKNTYFWYVAIFLMLFGLHLHSDHVVNAQTYSSRCIANVPREWGAFKGVSQSYGIAFEDASGTLRFVNQFPCGLEHAPNVSLELRRQ